MDQHDFDMLSLEPCSRSEMTHLCRGIEIARRMPMGRLRCWSLGHTVAAGVLGGYVSAQIVNTIVVTAMGAHRALVREWRV